MSTNPLSNPGSQNYGTNLEDPQQKVEEAYALAVGKSGWFNRNLTQLETKIAAFSNTELSNFLTKICDLSPKRINKCLEKGNLNNILNAVNEKLKINITPQLLNTIAINYKISHQKVKETQKDAQVSYNTSRPNALDNLILAHSYFSLEHEPDGPYEATQALQIIAFLVFAPIFLSTVFYDILDDYTSDYLGKAEYAGIIVGVVIVALVTIAIYKRCRPIPNHVRPMKNFTLEAIQSKMDPLLGRDDVVERVFACWKTTSSNLRRHPLLVGPAGVGKTVIMMEIGRRIATNEVPEGMKKQLKGKKMFRGPSPLLIADKEGGIDRFLRRIENHKNEVVVALDEIHAFFTAQNEAIQGEFLKSILDTSSRGLPYVLGATTDEEYKRYIAHDPARARRFEVINVTELNKEKVKLTLRQTMRRTYPNHPVSEEILDYVFEKSKELSASVTKIRQPELSGRIIATALSTITIKEQEIPSSKTLEDKRVEQLNLYSIHNQSFTGLESVETLFINDSKKLDDETKNLEKKVETEKQEIQDYKDLTKKLAQAHESIIELAGKTNEVFNQKRVAFIIYYQIPYLKERLTAIRDSLKIPVLDRELIDKTLEDFIRSQKNAGSSETEGSQDQPGGEDPLKGTLRRANALGNDATLETNGDHRTYLYSILDGNFLVRSIRSNNLTYKTQDQEFKIPGGDSYSSDRENAEGVFIAGPYQYLNFANSLADDIATITGTHAIKEKNNAWNQRPTLLIIPFLNQSHWYLVRIEINYSNGTSSILWDDPYGQTHFDKTIQQTLSPHIKTAIATLLQKDDKGLAPNELYKVIDQQGIGKNASDCGTIVFSNISDYIDTSTKNSSLATGNDDKQFTVKLASSSDHEKVILGLRAQHKKEFIAMKQGKG